jgi:hypothetical protein
MTQPEKPWAEFQLHVCKEVQSLINMTVVTTVGDGSNTLFLKFRWLNGKSIKDIAPYIYAMVLARMINKRKVIEAFANMRWLTDFQGALNLQVLLSSWNFIKCWTRLSFGMGWQMCTCGDSLLGPVFHKISLYSHVSRSNFV